MKISNGRNVEVVKNGEHGLRVGTIAKARSKHIIGNEIYYMVSNEDCDKMVNSACLRAV